MANIRRLEAQLAQEKFFHEKSKAEQQQEIKVKCIEFDSYFSFHTTVSLSMAALKLYLQLVTPSRELPVQFGKNATSVPMRF